jgi:hypothetical protein
MRSLHESPIRRGGISRIRHKEQRFNPVGGGTRSMRLMRQKPEFLQCSAKTA